MKLGIALCLVLSVADQSAHSLDQIKTKKPTQCDTSASQKKKIILEQYHESTNSEISIVIYRIRPFANINKHFSHNS